MQLKQRKRMNSFNLKLKEKTPISKTVLKLVFDLSGHDFEYKAGQFVMVNIDDKIKRAYSIASAPCFSKNELVFIIDTAPGGIGSDYFKKLSIGDIISFNGPFGKFGLSEYLEKDLYFIATGTGIAPLISMIDELSVMKESEMKRIHLILGTRTIDDLIYKDWALNLLENGKIDSYNVYLSRDISTENNIHKGYVSDHFSKIINLENSQYFLCGRRQIIEDIRDKLLNLNVKKDYIFTEGF